MSELVAFTTDHVCRLTGLSQRQLRYWAETEFFSPTIVHAGRRTFGRVYAFRDVVGLRAIAVLRNRYRVSLQELRRVGAWLKQRFETDSPWASMRLGIAGRKVVFLDPMTDRPTEVGDSEQTVLAFQPIAADMSAAAARLRDRTQDEIGRVVRNRYVVQNAWVLAGTRVPTRAVWHFHKEGYGEAAILREYPRLTHEDVKAAIEFERSRLAAA
jgi:uncharacterized protein (DUF433 family)